MIDTKRYRVKGSHRTEREIMQLLGRDPGIHNGYLPRGNFNLDLTEKEFAILKENDIKITIDKRFI